MHKQALMIRKVRFQGKKKEAAEENPGQTKIPKRSIQEGFHQFKKLL